MKLFEFACLTLLLFTGRCYSQYNIALYWGQDGGGTEPPLATVCSSSQATIINIAFVDIFFDQNDNGLPGINLSDHCSASFPGLPDLLDCPQVAADIVSCQQQGIKVIISLGGSSGAYGFSSSSQATQFAQTIWDLFLGGQSSTRPFGTAVLDGADLDIEGGSSNYYGNFVASLRSLMNSGNKQYYISAAPQCPYPDAYIGPALQSNGNDFDFIWVQFYNNYCNVLGGSFNFNTWAASVSSNTQVFVGLPASPQAAGSGYVPPNQIGSVLDGLESNSVFGGVMLWDAGWNEQTGYSNQIASILHINNLGNSTVA